MRTFESDKMLLIGPHGPGFDKDLEYFGVVVADLKRPPEKWVFWTWLSEKQKKWQKKRYVVNKAKLLKYFGHLKFFDLDNGVLYTVCHVNIHWEPHHGYCALGVAPGGACGDGEREADR